MAIHVRGRGPANQTQDNNNQGLPQRRRARPARIKNENGTETSWTLVRGRILAGGGHNAHLRRQVDKAQGTNKHRRNEEAGRKAAELGGAEATVQTSGPSA